MSGDSQPGNPKSDAWFRQLAFAFETLGDAVTIVDTADTIIFVNSAAEKLYGYSREEMLGQPITLIVPRSSSPVSDQMVKSSPSERWEGDVTRVRKGGDHFPVHLTVTFLRDEGGQVIGRIGVAQDISTRIRAEEATRRLALENAVLAEIGRIVSSSLDISEVYEVLAAEICKLIPFDGLAVELINSDSGTFVNAYTAGVDIPGWRVGESRPVRGTLAEEVVNSQVGIIASGDAASSPPSRPIPEAEGMSAGFRSVLIVPLKSKNEVIGVLSVGSLSPDAYDESRLRLAERIAAQIAGAIANSRLHADLQREARHKALLAEIGRTIGMSLDIDEAYCAFAELVSHLIPFDRIAINLINPDGKTLTSAYVMGMDIPGRRQGEMLALEGSLTLKAMEAWSGLLLQPGPEEDVTAQFPALAPMLAGGLRSFIAVPLVSRDRVIGVLHLASKKPMAYTGQDLVLAQSVGAQIAGAIANAQLNAEFKRADEALRRQLAAMDTSIDGIAIVDQRGSLLYVNNALVKMYGYDRPEELLGNLWDILYNEEEVVRIKQEVLPQVYREGQWRGETIGKRRDGKTFPQEISLSSIQGGGLVCIDRDITERKRLEEQLFQSQKMEAVGRLAGGIAHDFNNLLTAVMGYAYLAMNVMPRDSSVYRYLEEIQASAERAANLTNQLLAFSRRQIAKPRVVDLNDLIRKLDLMLRRLIGENIEFSPVLEPELWPVKVDPGQIEQVLVNLVVNARDAMPAGGRLSIKTENAGLDHGNAQQHPELAPGDYVVLSVSDTGIGMTDYVKAHLFEPFFTTKPVGKGTGLGLSTCYGIIKQSGGHITAQSKAGRGATFTIYLPRAREAARPSVEVGQSSQLPGGNETVLVVEDEPTLRYLAVHILRERGYHVLEAADGLEALAVAEAHADEVIHLLLTDVVMPHMDGKQLAEQLKRIHPETRVLFTSGYTNDIVVRNGVLRQGAAFLLKPYSVATLAVKVREVLDRASQGSTQEAMGSFDRG